MYILLSIFTFAVVLLSAGFLYQWIGAQRDRMRYASDGRWIKIGRRSRLYLLEKGSGGPTVLFESGIAATNLNWCHIQETVSQFTHTASYDRSGLGWSSRLGGRLWILRRGGAFWEICDWRVGRGVGRD